MTAALHPLLAQKGVAETQIFLNWEEMVGFSLARICQPERLEWKSGPLSKFKEKEKKGQEGEEGGEKKRGKKKSPSSHPQPGQALLVLRVARGRSLEVQHALPLLKEKLNTSLGWPCIGALRLGPDVFFQKSTQENRGASFPFLPDSSPFLSQAQAATEGIEKEALKTALTRLGMAVLRSQGRS